MDYDGLVLPYPVGRRLSADEMARRLEIGVAVEAVPNGHFAVIRRDASSLEIVDKYYEWKGSMTLFAMLGLAVLGTPIALAIAALLESQTAFSGSERGGAIILVCVIACIGLPVLGLCGWLLSREMFTWTHYPVLFDRSRQRVLVRRTRRGTDVLEIAWSDVFWHARHSKNKPTGVYTWFLAGHVLERDGKTVRETFSFGRSASSPEELDPLWEFVRRFMQEGADSMPQPPASLPIANRREDFLWGAHMLLFVAPANLALTVALLPLLAPAAVCRWVAMRTNRPPRWPASLAAHEPLDAVVAAPPAVPGYSRVRVAAALVSGLAVAAWLAWWLLATALPVR